MPVLAFGGPNDGPPLPSNAVVYGRPALLVGGRPYLVEGNTLTSPAGRVYRVMIWASGYVSCDCKGHLYRRQCKHTKAVVAAAERAESCDHE